MPDTATQTEATPPFLSPGEGVGQVIWDMPARWRGVALLNPYQNDTIRAVETQCDHLQGIMLHRSVGVDDSAFRLLYAGDGLFILPSCGNAPPIGPIDLGRPVPGTDMFAKHDMRNQGHAPLMGQPCSFFLGWTPNANGFEHKGKHDEHAEVCNWVWWNNEMNLPARWFFTNSDNPYGIPYLGMFALATFTDFERLQDGSHLLLLLEECTRDATAPPPGLGAAIQAAKSPKALHDAIADGLPPEYSRTDIKGEAGRLVQGLEPAAPGTAKPGWVNRIRMTGFTYQTARQPKQTPNLMGNPAMPLRVFYDWSEDDPSGEKAQMLTRVSLDQHSWDGAPYMDIHLDRNGNDTYVLEPGGPCYTLGHGPRGIVRQDWAKNDGGIAKARLVDNPVICPGETLDIIALQSNYDRWFWVWYTPGNKGQLFMEVPQKADVLLVLTDYYTYDMDPAPFPKGWSEHPSGCKPPPASS